MKKLFSILSVILFCNCGLMTSEQDAITAARTSGFTNIRVVSSSKIFQRLGGCTSEDAAAYSLTGINSQGKKVAITACVGWPCKGTTLRY